MGGAGWKNCPGIGGVPRNYLLFLLSEIKFQAPSFGESSSRSSNRLSE
jgi:hypothetical protein